MNIIIAILILGIIVIVHELGHFLLAKKNGITVTEFSVGMGPRIASFVRNGTRYSLKLLPIGGSCMMLGEDETIDDEGAFHKKGVWARFSVIFAGAFFNFVFAFILALILLGDAGVDKPIIDLVRGNTPAEDAGLVQGDQITEIDGSPIHFSRDIDYYFYFKPLAEKPVEITYLRDGKKATTTLTPVWVDRYQIGCDYDDKGKRAELTLISEGAPLDAAGVEVGDVIINMNGTDITTGKDLEVYLDTNPLTKAPVTISYLKGGQGEPITITINPKLVESGYSMGWYSFGYREKVNAFEVIKYSFYELKLNIVNTIKSVLYLVTGKLSANEISGPVGIVNYVGDVVSESKDYGIRITLLSLIQFSILISANLGVMNLLPLPALDGGRLVFLLIEAVMRKPVPKEKEAMVHMVGMVLLMLLMVFVLFNDIKNIFG